MMIRSTAIRAHKNVKFMAGALASLLALVQ